MILDKLLEKKDLLIYIDKRTEHLERKMEGTLKSLPPKKRELVVERFRGRFLELRYLRKHVDNLKDTSKRYWLDCARDNEHG